MDCLCGCKIIACLHLCSEKVPGRPSPSVPDVLSRLSVPGQNILGLSLKQKSISRLSTRRSVPSSFRPGEEMPFFSNPFYNENRLRIPTE